MIEIGKTYLNIWGRPHTIAGPAKGYTEPVLYSNQGHHFRPDGTDMSSGHYLIDDLSIPVSDAVRVWEDRIKLIRDANDFESKRALIAGIVRPMIVRKRWLSIFCRVQS